jgi:hypothetical protein
MPRDPKYAHYSDAEIRQKLWLRLCRFARAVEKMTATPPFFQLPQCLEDDLRDSIRRLGFDEPAEEQLKELREQVEFRLFERAERIRDAAADKRLDAMTDAFNRGLARKRRRHRRG